jgi:hypothetical protein
VGAIISVEICRACCHMSTLRWPRRCTRAATQLAPRTAPRALPPNEQRCVFRRIGTGTLHVRTEAFKIFTGSHPAAQVVPPVMLPAFAAGNPRCASTLLLLNGALAAPAPARSACGSAVGNGSKTFVDAGGASFRRSVIAIELYGSTLWPYYRAPTCCPAAHSQEPT